MSNTEERYSTLRSIGEECIQEEELKQLVEKKPSIRCYDGFEPSGRMHIAQGVYKAINVNKCTSSGCEFIFWVADWFALMNDKVGGELNKIRTVGEYFIEVWKSAGMEMEKVSFLWTSKEITENPQIYWRLVLDIGKRNTIARIKKCCTIMGKAEGKLSAAQILYPLMQCADIFFLKADICQLGLDQRKVNMLAREYCDAIKKKLKPVILSHHMLAGLKKGQAKMSKSDPDSAIFMEDTVEDVTRKIQAAYCPKKEQLQVLDSAEAASDAQLEKNPVLDYFEFIIFSKPGAKVTINGTTYDSYAKLEEDFANDTISESALKNSLIAELNQLLEPVRKHFATDARAAKLLEEVKTFRKGGDAPTIEKPSLSTVDSSSPPTAIAWIPPVSKLSLDTAIGIVKGTNDFFSRYESGNVVLVLPDWSSFARDELSGVESDITAVLEFNQLLLKASGLSERVKIMKQSELIFANANDYWIKAINVGRRYDLQYIEKLYHGEVSNAGQVIACLMCVADILLTKATHVVCTQYDYSLKDIIISATNDSVTVIPPSNTMIPTLQAPDAPLHGPDSELLLLDDEATIKRKIKKAYCAPNECDNPVFSIALWIVDREGSLTISHADPNNESSKYTEASALRTAFEDGSIHPGDLKAAVTAYLLNYTSSTRASLTSPDGVKYIRTLKNIEKKIQKAN